MSFSLSESVTIVLHAVVVVLIGELTLTQPSCCGDLWWLILRLFDALALQICKSVLCCVAFSKKECAHLFIVAPPQQYVIEFRLLVHRRLLNLKVVNVFKVQAMRKLAVFLLFIITFSESLLCDITDS